MRPIRAVTMAALMAAGCGPGSAPGSGSAADAAADSATAAELARFRAKLTPPAGLADGERSLDALVARYLGALETRDADALVRMHVTDAEYAWLYYPESPYARRPYRQDPAVHRFLLVQNSQKGIDRALAAYGGRPLAVADVRCEDAPRGQGAGRLWERCSVLVAESGAGPPAPIRLFGSILERDGRFKFLSYANNL